MKKINVESRLIILGSVILFGALMRLLPHWPNFTPVAAMALFGGAYFGKKILAFLVPLAALFLSDLILGLHQWVIPVYASFAIVVLIGFSLKNRVKGSNLLLASLGSSVVFYLITNFAVWIGSPFYPQNIAGLLESYTLALPFFYNGILANLFYTALFFGAFYLVQTKYPALVRVKY